jgi:hypothetical protein
MSSRLSHRASGAIRRFAGWVARGSVGHPMLDGINYWDELKDSPSKMETCFAIFANVLELDDRGEPINKKYAERCAATWLYRYCTGELLTGEADLEPWECALFEATSADIADLGEEHGHRVLRVCGKGTKVILVPLPPAAGRASDRANGTRTRGPILLNSRGARMDRHATTRRLTEAAGSGSPGRTPTCSATRSSRPCWTRAWICGTSRSPPATPTRAP